MNPAGRSRLTSPGAACSFLIGGLYVFIILYAVAVPAGNRFETGHFFEDYSRNPLVMDFLWAVMAAISLVSLALIPSVSALFREGSPEWIAVAENFGVAGAITSAVSFLTMLGSAPGLANTYMNGDPVTRTAINALGLPQLDPLRVLILGGTGLWFLLINLEAWRMRQFSKPHAGIGMVLGIFLWAAVLAAILHLDILDQIAAGVGGLCAPAWYFLTGIKLLGKITSITKRADSHDISVERTGKIHEPITRKNHWPTANLRAYNPTITGVDRQRFPYNRIHTRNPNNGSQ